MSDVLAGLKPPELAVFYRRIADAVDKNLGSVKVSLAATLMRHWLENRNPNSVFELEAPEHLKNRVQVLDVLEFHRKVFLTQEKARYTGGATRWAGVVPRLMGQPPYEKWNINLPLSMEYESLVEIPVIMTQMEKNPEDLDILYSLHGFQLKSNVTVTAIALLGGNKLRINFRSFQAGVSDRYDWDSLKHITVPNPDYGSKEANAIAPNSDRIVIEHQNAKRLEAAGLAAPYNVLIKPWQVTDARFTAPAEVAPILPR